MYVGGVFGVTTGIYNRWPDRCIDTPISESAIVGAAAGAALVGMRPVAEIMSCHHLNLRGLRPPNPRTLGGFAPQTPPILGSFAR